MNLTTWISRKTPFALLTALALLGSGCQYVSEDVDEYPGDLFDPRQGGPLEGPWFVTFPTWGGSIIGATVGAAFLPLSWTAAFVVDSWFPEVYAPEQKEGLFVAHDGFDIAVMPMMGFGYFGGILLGTPFYSLYFPYDVTRNVIVGNVREPGGELKYEFREQPIEEPRETPPVNFPGG